MKSRTVIPSCLCPCPDYIKVPIEHGMTQTVIVNWPGVEVLHGKKADRECHKCGQPLCEDCAVAGGYGFTDGELYFWDRCAVCDEL